ncbi:hypothetical protein [Streptomyces drozdowiczii]|uniref:Transposase n=1 Tax=Streptomyces drozdowiczii TaxID=202862 RepID=A0ABY6PLY9_9ACTN|nr:hypothetical protein [Streptomyces drozdowiczii]MCX0247851.1 hypothetical protein [Streptomyces drozdowiczii]UZK52791.1 hypothetical protein NEH16_00505 [Streptomyces drozdowiczii]
MRILENWLDDQEDRQLTDKDGNPRYAVVIWERRGTERSSEPIAWPPAPRARSTRPGTRPAEYPAG